MRYSTAFVFVCLIQLLTGAHGAATIAVGDACPAGGNTCVTTATCQTTCKLNVGETCIKTDNPTKCVDHATCQTVSGADKCTCDTGYSGTTTCIIAGALGGDCLTGSTCTATATDTCEASKCRRKIGQACTASSTDQCVSTAVSPCPASAVCGCVTGKSASTDKTKCIADGALDGACLTGSTCTTTATDTCDATASKCRRMIGQSCTAGSTTECVSTAATCPSTTLCTCPTGQTPNTDKTKCSGAASVIASLALLLASVVTSRYL